MSISHTNTRVLALSMRLRLEVLTLLRIRGMRFLAIMVHRPDHARTKECEDDFQGQ
jgi:hypothetical protein